MKLFHFVNCNENHSHVAQILFDFYFVSFSPIETDWCNNLSSGFSVSGTEEMFRVILLLVCAQGWLLLHIDRAEGNVAASSFLLDTV